jgi:hypothetical protein
MSPLEPGPVELKDSRLGEDDGGSRRGRRQMFREGESEVRTLGGQMRVSKSRRNPIR